MKNANERILILAAVVRAIGDGGNALNEDELLDVVKKEFPEVTMDDIRVDSIHKLQSTCFINHVRTSGKIYCWFLTDAGVKLLKLLKNDN